MDVADCIACRGEWETPVLHESPFWRVVINRNQNLLGKTIIVLRRHEEDVPRLTSDEWADLLAELGWVTERVRHAFAADHFNYSFLMNMDAHVHLHVIPRYLDSRELAGVQFSDPDYPDAYRGPVTPSEIAAPSVVAAVHEALAEAKV
ncbi:MAG TPA: HIT family protein [Gaiellaceae bacterium]|nr:HIT family protein [Gaiellaceae bacterium]